MPLSFRSAAYLALASAIVTATPVIRAMADDDDMKDAEALKQAIKQGEILPLRYSCRGPRKTARRPGGRRRDRAEQPAGSTI